ncbi:bifunctional serine/threonine-protein kinase/ABC transporter substrate-binding protein [Actinomadura fulvescens]|uniref:Protein kinase domain-containing protein n=1 Tax=Actinomadura fulvescens TaxID=46160 RepID=A0ABN3P9B7_9ACTN
MADPLLPDDPRWAGAYELVGRLGEGGQGSVFLGRDRQGRDVAVKLLHSRLGSNAVARRRFMRELEVAERVSGFCTARVLDADVLGDRPYIVSEYVRGPSLTDVVLDEGPLDQGALMRLAIGTATALVAIHRAGIVHRDFKPPNVLIGPGGPRVIDFGIARALDASAATLSSAVGTPAYMAPEQVAQDDVGPAADLFAWGGTMVFAATGRRPFPAESIPALFHQVLNAEPDLTGVPEQLAELVAACLSKDPALRPTSSELLHRLMALIGAEPPPGADPVERGAEVIAAPTVPPARPRPARARRRPWRLATIPVVLVTLAIAVPVVIANFGPDRGASGADGPVVKVGVMVPLTGSSRAYGVSAMNAAKLAVQDHHAQNPRMRVELVPIDTKGDPAEAEKAAQRAAGLAAVVGPMLGGESERAGPVLERKGLPSVSPSAPGPPSAKYWHTMVPDAKETVTALVPYSSSWDARGMYWTAVLNDGRPEVRAASDVFTAGVLKAKRRVRQILVSPPDFAGVGKRLLETNGVGNFVIGVFYGGGFATAGPLIAQARKEGFKERFHLTASAFDDRLIELAGARAAEGTLLACPCVDVSRGTKGMPKDLLEFLARYAKANGGARPGPYGPEAYDATKGILYAISAGDTTPEKINAHLRTLDIQGVTQRIRFDGKGRLRDSISYLYEVRGGRFVLVGPAAGARP